MARVLTGSAPSALLVSMALLAPAAELVDWQAQDLLFPYLEGLMSPLPTLIPLSLLCLPADFGSTSAVAGVFSFAHPWGLSHILQAFPANKLAFAFGLG